MALSIHFSVRRRKVAGRGGEATIALRAGDKANITCTVVLFKIQWQVLIS